MGAAAVDACLLAGGHLLDPQSIVPDAIDELERIVAAAYRPGRGLARSVNDPGGARGALADHVRTSSALLTAFDFSGRLPYPMLAEELMQFARETLWDEESGAFQRSGGRFTASRSRSTAAPHACSAGWRRCTAGATIAPPP